MDNVKDCSLSARCIGLYLVINIVLYSSFCNYIDCRIFDCIIYSCLSLVEPFHINSTFLVLIQSFIATRKAMFFFLKFIHLF